MEKIHLLQPENLSRENSKGALIAKIYIMNLLGGRSGQFLNDSIIDNIQFANGEYSLDVYGKTPGTLWGEGAVTVLENGGCEASLVDQDQYGLAPAIKVRISEFTLKRVEKLYEKDISEIIKNTKTNIDSALEDDDEETLAA